MLTNFNELFYNEELKKDFQEVVNNNFKALFPEVTNTYDINYVTARSIVSGKYREVMFDVLEIIENGPLKHSPYKKFHASSWLKIIHNECGSSFVKLMNEFKKLDLQFNDEEISWNKVFYAKQKELGMD